MKKLTIAVLAVAVTAAFAAAPASASAGTTSATAAAAPPCVPGVPVPNALDCVFDTAAWAVQEVNNLPQTVINLADQLADQAIFIVNNTIVTAGEAVNQIEEDGIDSVCWLLFGSPDGECVSLR